MVSESATSTAFYRPTHGQMPRSQKERYKRVHRYVSQLGDCCIEHIKKGLNILQLAADQLPEPALRAAARHSPSDANIAAAAKEMLCLWIYQEAVDQGGEAMPSWLTEFLSMSLHASDLQFATPEAAKIMAAYETATPAELPMLACQSLAQRLDFGESGAKLAPVFAPLFEDSRSTRQGIFKEALTVDATEL